MASRQRMQLWPCSHLLLAQQDVGQRQACTRPACWPLTMQPPTAASHSRITRCTNLRSWNNTAAASTSSTHLSERETVQPAVVTRLVEVARPLVQQVDPRGLEDTQAVAKLGTLNSQVLAMRTPPSRVRWCRW
jgi:hypothetical protein